MKKLLQKLDSQALKKINAALLAHKRIGVACSGGSDSVFLLFAALQIIPADKICVLHFNHAVRENSAHDEEFVKRLCEKLNVECVLQTRAKSLKKISEETLRDARLEFFKDAAKTHKLSLILQGHIKDDIAETMLMRLARGSSLDGICAPRPVSKHGGLVFARPLLGISKDEIQHALKKQKQTWREDESNAQEIFTRNKMRKRIIPEIEKSQNRDFKECAARTRALLEEDTELIAKIFEKHCKPTSANAFTLDTFAAGSPALARRCVQALLSRNALKLRAANVDAFVEKILEGAIAQASLKNASLNYNAKSRTLRLSKKVKAEKFCVDLKFGENILPDGSAIIVEEIKADKKLFDLFKNTLVDESKCAYAALPATSLCARTILPKDAYAPIGAKSPRLVKDMMSARKIDILKRKRFPLVCLKDAQTLWVPSLAPSESFKVEKGKRAIRLTYVEQA